MTFCIDFEPVGRRGGCPEGATLLDCARQLGVDLVNLCGGTGSCGRCMVQVMKGDVSAPVPGEDNDYVYRELLGMNAGEIASLAENGVI